MLTGVDIKKVRCLPEITCYSNHGRVLATDYGNLLYDLLVLKELGQEHHGLAGNETSGSG